VVGGVLLGDAQAFLEQLEAERSNRGDLEQASKWLDSGNVEKAKPLLESASATKLLRAKFVELEARRVKLVSEKTLAAKPTPKPTKPEPVRVEPTKPEPAQVDPAAAQANALFAEGRAENKAKNFAEARSKLERCIKVLPSHHPCYWLLGSVFASIAARDQSPKDQAMARRYYETYLEIAPPGDPYIEKVKAILEVKPTP
jgi:hypothetical protein